MEPAMRSLVHSYLFLRRAIGIIGMALPVVLIVGYLLWPAHDVLASISGYYYSPLRGAFVGSMCAVGVFLLSYSGTEFFEDLISDIAGVAAICVALFPTTPPPPVSGAQHVVATVHAVSACVFFGMLALFCLLRFPRANEDETTATVRPKWHNIVYYAAGGVIVASLLLVVVSSRIPGVEPIHPMLILETAAIVAFGVAWFVKGVESVLEAPVVNEVVPQAAGVG
jgi:hypothetical protein